MLTKPAISEFALEKSTLELWDEWLRLWFDGGSHAVGVLPPQVFPKCHLRYQQSSLPDPLNGVGISTVWVRPAVTRYAWETVTVASVRQTQRMAYARTAFMFWIRAELPQAGAAVERCRAVSDLLFGLLQNSAATRDLHQRGLHRFRPESPVLVSSGSGSKPTDPSYAMRLITCPCSLHYPVVNQG